MRAIAEQPNAIRAYYEGLAKEIPGPMPFTPQPIAR